MDADAKSFLTYHSASSISVGNLVFYKAFTCSCVQLMHIFPDHRITKYCLIFKITKKKLSQIRFQFTGILKANDKRTINKDRMIEQTREFLQRIMLLQSVWRKPSSK